MYEEEIDLDQQIEDELKIIEKKIEYIEMPRQLIGSYQYFTEANMQKLRATGIRLRQTSLEAGVADYVKNYLIPGELHLQDGKFSANKEIE